MFLFGVHMHQPVDNFKSAIDEAVKKSYLPFFETVYDYKNFKFSLHCSGWLFQKIKKDYNYLFEIIKELEKKERIEIFGGGFYEPVLSAIPLKDRIGQIKKLNEFIEDNFEFKPKGVWIAERVWDEGIIPQLKETGFNYTLLDDHHFFASGKEDIKGYYSTEYGGERFYVFPIMRKLRYALPFWEAKDAVALIENIEFASVFDDLEKFGLWPKTHDWVFEKGWLNSFLEIIEQKNIKTVLFGEFFDNNKSDGLIYLDNVSYAEMGKWASSPKYQDETHRAYTLLDSNGFDAERIIRDGLWKNFFVKYEHSNWIHKRMLELSLDGKKTKNYRDCIFRLQTNDVYWHGVFGGLYMPNLRDNAYRYIIECENTRKKAGAVEVSDVNMDGYDEIKFYTPSLISIFDSHFGGQLIELDDRESLFNFQNTLTRRKEFYHQHMVSEKAASNKGIDTIHTVQMTMDESLINHLKFDWYVKNSFIDHITDANFNLNNFYGCDFREFSDFANQPFTYSVGRNSVVFKREGGIYEDSSTYTTSLKKEYRLNDKGFEFEISVGTESKNRYLYVLELNLHFANYDKVKINGVSFKGFIEESATGIFTIEDEFSGKIMRFRLNDVFKLLVVPLETVSKSESGFKLTTQALSFAVVLPLYRNLKLKGELEISHV